MEFTEEGGLLYQHSGCSLDSTSCRVMSVGRQYYRLYYAVGTGIDINNRVQCSWNRILWQYAVLYDEINHRTIRKQEAEQMFCCYRKPTRLCIRQNSDV